MRKTAGTLHFRMIQIKPAIKSKAQKQLELKEGHSLNITKSAN